MILGILLISILLAYYMYFRQMRKKLYKLSDSLPDVGSLPLIGHTHWFLGGPEKILGNIEKLSDLVLERTDTTKIWVGPTFYFVTVNPEDVAKILENCLQKDVSYRFLRDWLGNGLFVSQVDQWRIHRRALMPIFQNRNVEEYIDIFAGQSLVLVERLRERSGQPPFDVYPLITSCTLDIVFETAIGEKMDVQRNPDTPYLRARRYILQVINMRIFKAWLRPDALFRLTPHFKSQKESIDLTHKFTDEVVQRKRDIYDKQGFPNEGRKDFLEHILSKNSNYTNEQLREHIDSITIAGNDTTALVIAYTLLAMGIHQDIQEKVYQEQKHIFGDSMRPATKEDMSKMEYLERVMKETMRFYTVVPIIGRETEKEIKLSSCTLPPGVSCAVLPFVMHRSKALWGPDVKEFDPDRFLPERSIGRHPCAFLAFSHGTRNCIGRHYGMLLMKTIVSNIVRNFRIFSKAPTRFKIEIIMFPVDGHLITVEPRSSLLNTLVKH